MNVEGFDDALDGFYDVADLPARYLLERTADELAAVRERKRAIDSVEAFEERRDRIRRNFLEGIGGLPDRPDDPSVETTGVLEREDHTVELVVYESLPDFRVTANCYVPVGEGPHPAVLFCCGHVGAAKADELNQKACLELVANGFVVLAFDPLCQGERIQYLDDGGGPRFGGGGAIAHSYAGQQCYYAGANLARYVIHDARQGLDYLHDRPDVDGDRVGVTGTSGGGTQTAYLALTDDRVDAAAPCCYVCDREAFAKTGNSGDAEQNVAGAVPKGIDYDDLLAGMAPRPVCVGAARSDRYFPIEGVYDAVDRLRSAYDLYDAAGNVELVVADCPHASVFEIGAGVFEFLCEHLGDGDYEPRGEYPVVEERRLRCTPEGSVRVANPDERSIHDLIRAYVREAFPDGGANQDPADRPSHDTGDDAGATPEGWSEHARRTRDRVVDTLGLDRDGCDLHPRVVREERRDGLDLRYVFFKTERNPDAVVAGVLATDPDRPTDAPAVVCYEEGTGELPDRGEDLADIARERGAALAVDPRGVGAVRNRWIHTEPWVEDYHGVYGTEYKLGYDALLLGESLFGMRVYDVLRAVEFLRGETGSDADTVSLVGDGVGAYHALYAAAVEESVARVEFRNLGPSFYEMASAREYPYDPRLLVPGVLDGCDLPDLLAALDDRDVAVERTAD